MLVNLNQYRATLGIFNNRFIVCGNFGTNLFHSKSYSNFTFIFFGVFFIAVIHFNIFIMYIVYLFPTFFHPNCKHIFIYLRLALYIFVVVLDDFNVKSENWYKHDKATYKGAKIDTLTTQFR